MYCVFLLMLITSYDHANMTFALIFFLALEVAHEFFVSIKVYLGFAHNFYSGFVFRGNE